MPDPEQTDTPASADQALPYLRALYANVLEWYKIAETKGQLLLTLNGLLVTAVAGALIVKPPDAATRVDVFGVETWAFVASLVVTVSASVACAAMTVASRLEDSKVTNLLNTYMVRTADRTTYRPEVAWWFGYLATLEAEEITKYLREGNRSLERDALSSAAVQLSGNVLAKHKWVNRGWAFVAFALLSLVGAALSIAIRAAA